MKLDFEVDDVDYLHGYSRVVTNGSIIGWLQTLFKTMCVRWYPPDRVGERLISMENQRAIKGLVLQPFVFDTIMVIQSIEK